MLSHSSQRLRLWLIVLLLFGSSSVFAASQKPNFVLIMADDCTYWDMECYGGQAKTPHLNKLCSEGMKFTKCFQAAPMCSPTRHCLYTGIYPVKSGAHPNHTFVYPGTKSIVHHLKPNGYRVALSGKRHINPPESFPFVRLNKKGKKKGGNNPDFEEVTRFLKQRKKDEKPFCLFACSNEPHTPWNKGDASAYPPAKLKLPPFFVDTPKTRSDYSKYLAEITYFDSQVGECMSILDKLELRDNTVVMVLSEQGNSFPFAKWTCYEMGVASGMIVRWPGKVKPRSVNDALVEYVDVVPTFLSIAGVNAPKGLDGRSFREILLGAKREHKEYVYSVQTSRGIINGPKEYGIRTIRSKKYRYVLNLTPEVKFRNAIMNRRSFWPTWVAKAEKGDKHAQAMVQRYQKRPGEELFDVTADPYNQKNLANDPKLAEIKQDLKQRLQAWMKAQGDLGAETERKAHLRQWKNRKRQ